MTWTTWPADARLNLARRLAARFPHDPVSYCHEVLGVVLTPQQQDICNALLEPPHRVFVRASHSVGKTFLAACLASWHFDSFDPGITLTTAPTSHQVRDLLFKELRRLRPFPQGFLPKTTRLQSSPAHFVHGLTAQDGNAFQGRHAEHMMLIFDEAIGIDPVFWETGESMLGEGHFWLAIGNPTDPGSYAKQAEESGRWTVISLSALDHPNVTEQLAGRTPPIPGAITLARLQEMLASWATVVPDGEPALPGDIELAGVRYRPGAVAEARLLGRWPTEGTDGLWSESLWDRMLATRHSINPDWPVAIGCDVGRYGDDHTLIVVRKGWCVLHVESHVKQSTSVVAQRLRDLCDHFKDAANTPKGIPCQIDEGGIGGGVIDQAEGYTFIPVNAARRPCNPARYPRVRDELWFSARELALQGAIDLSRLPPPFLTRLKQELLAARYRILPGTDKVQVSSKDDMKALLRRSPDLADAFNLCFYPTGL